MDLLKRAIEIGAAIIVVAVVLIVLGWLVSATGPSMGSGLPWLKTILEVVLLGMGATGVSLTIHFVLKVVRPSDD